jgi:hypothetical protein
MKVFIGIPSVRNYEPFWKSMDEFLPILKRQVDVEVCIVKDKTIAEARNQIVDEFLASDSDYLLFLDDDHSGHTLQMFNSLLDPILNNNAYMCGMKCYTKIFPYFSNISIYSNVNEKELGIVEGSGKYMPVDFDRGYGYVDLVGFGMTIVSRGTFDLIEKPYFISKDNKGEDNYFCDNLIKAGIRPVGCFEDVLEHMGIGKHNDRILRDKGYAELKEKYPDMKVLVA